MPLFFIFYKVRTVVKILFRLFVFCFLMSSMVWAAEDTAPQEERMFSVTLSLDENDVLKMEMFGKVMPTEEALLFLEQSPMREKYDVVRLFYSDSMNRRMEDSPELHPDYVKLLAYSEKSGLVREHVLPPTDFIPYWHCMRQKKALIPKTPLKEAEELVRSLIVEAREKSPETPVFFITFGFPEREVEEFSSIDEAVKAVKSILASETRYEKIFFYDDRTLQATETRDLMDELICVALEHDITFEHFILTSGVPPESAVFYRYHEKKVWACEYTIPEGVTEIEEKAFLADWNLSAIHFPESLLHIRDGAFYNCQELESVRLPKNLETIGEMAFSYCYRLTEIQVDKENRNFRSQDGALFTADGKTLVQFPAGKGGDYTIPEGVTEIRAGAFAGCRVLKSLKIPTSVTKIGGGAFEDCLSLETLDIPENITEIEPGTFADCRSLKKAVIPRNVTKIGRGAFSGCQGLKSIVIPRNVTEVGRAAFSDCANLTEILVEEGNSCFQSVNGTLLTATGEEFLQCPAGKNGEFIVPAGVKSIAESAFAGCEKLTRVTLPDGVSRLGDCAFCNCVQLRAFELPPSLNSIGDSAFSGCWNLISVKLPPNVTSVGQMAFEMCESLEIVKLPSGLTRLEAFTFLNCRNLRSVEFQEGLEFIGVGCFANCRSLVSVTLPASVKTVECAFSNCQSLKEILVKSGNPNFKSVDGVLYSADGTDLIQCPAGKTGDFHIPPATRVMDGAFDGCGKLKIQRPQ